MATLEFLLDVGSPNAYLSYKVVPDIVARTGADLTYTPILLGGIFKATGNQPPWQAYVEVKMAYERLEMMRFIEKHKLTDFKLNPNFPINTVMGMRGAVFAQENGFFPAYIEALLHHMWEAGTKMDDPEAFAAAFTEAGLDGKAILEGTQDPAVKDKLKANTEEAVSRGVFGIPTFFVGKEMFFGKDRLDQVEEELSRT